MMVFVACLPTLAVFAIACSAYGCELSTTCGQWGSIGAPGIFFDPLHRGPFRGCTKRKHAHSATIWTSSPSPRTPYFVILWALLFFDNGYFDASFTSGIWYIWILTQFHQISSIFCSLAPHLLFTRLISPHYGDPKKAGVL